MSKWQMHSHSFNTNPHKLFGDTSDYHHNRPGSEKFQSEIIAAKSDGAIAELVEKPDQLENDSLDWVSIYFFA